MATQNTRWVYDYTLPKSDSERSIATLAELSDRDTDNRLCINVLRGQDDMQIHVNRFDGKSDRWIPAVKISVNTDGIPEIIE